MKPETLEALKGSIAKWKRIVKSTKVEDRGGDNCPLCKSHRCAECPVGVSTGEVGCVNTPYIDWRVHQRQDHGRPGQTQRRVPHCKECLSIAREEVAFLENLLPKEK